MSESTDYQKALLDTEELYKNYQKQGKEPVGLTPFDTASLSDAIIVKQNNTIILSIPLHVNFSTTF